MSKVFSGPTSLPWEYIPSTEHHGPYVTCLTGDICDCYTMSNPAAASVRNGGESYPIHHQGKQADANAQRIVLAVNNFDALSKFFLAARLELPSDQFLALCIGAGIRESAPLTSQLLPPSSQSTGDE
jgi:hypothetical protein